MEFCHFLRLCLRAGVVHKKGKVVFLKFVCMYVIPLVGFCS